MGVKKIKIRFLNPRPEKTQERGNQLFGSGKTSFPFAYSNVKNGEISGFL